MGITLYDQELENSLGEAFYEQICRFVQQGKLKPEREVLEELNRALNPNQVGKFQNSKATGRLAIREVLSVWYNSYPSEVQNNGRQRLINVLNYNPNVDLKALACKLMGNPGVPQPPSSTSSVPLARPFRTPKSIHPVKRAALIVGNTYENSNNMELLGCKTSVENVKKALESRGFDCELKLNIAADEILRLVTEFTENKTEFGARLFYFSGHGGNESFSVNGGGKAISQNLVGFVDTTGHLYEGGDYVLGQDGDKVFKDEILSRFAKDNKPNVHKILMFDCCRGEKSREMGDAQKTTFQLEIMRREEANQRNVHYKNVVILHGTLPHQVAWCTADGTGSTKFSKHFCAQLSKPGGVNISGMDEAINAELEKDQNTNKDTRGHVQMVEMTKRGISKPFIF